MAVLFVTAAAVLISAGARRGGLLLIGKMQEPEGFGAGFHDLFRRSTVRSTITLVSIEGLAASMSLTYAPSLMQRRVGISVLMSSFAMSLFAVGGILFAIFARRITTSCPASARASIGGSLAALGVGLIALVPSPCLAGCCMFVTGFRFFALHNTLQVRAIAMARETTSTAISLFAAAFFLAQTVGATVGSWLFDRSDSSLAFGISAVLFAGVGLTAAANRGDTS